MSHNRTANKTAFTTILASMSIFAIGNCMGGISGAFARMTDALDINMTQALFTGSIPSIFCVLASVIFAMFGRRLRTYRLTIIICCIVVIFAGTIPAIGAGYLFILISRGIYGIGLGGLQTLQTPVVSQLITSERRAFVLGICASTGFAFQCILQVVGGILADLQWNYVFLTHLILIIPLVILLRSLPPTEVPRSDPAEKQSEKLSGFVIFLCFIVALAALLASPMLFSGAFYVSNLSGDATAAGIISMMYSLGCMLGGVSYPAFFKRLRFRSFAVHLPLGACGFLLSATTDSLVILGLGFTLAGFGQCGTYTGVMTSLSLLCKPTVIGKASALMMGMINTCLFFCSSWLSLVGWITGDSLYAPLFIAAVIYILMALVLLWQKERFNNNSNSIS